MKKSSVTFIILTLAFTLLMISAPGNATTNKVILQIDGMT